MIFADTDIKITSEGQRHLGAALGSDNFRKTYTEEKVKQWCAEVKKLAEFAKSQPHAAYAAFVNGEVHKFTYFMRTIPEMKVYLKSLDYMINNVFLPALIEEVITEQDRKLYSLPVSRGGLGIPLLSNIAEQHLYSSKQITAPLVTIMVLQGNELPNVQEVNKLKRKVSSRNDSNLKEKCNAVEHELPDNIKKAVNDIKQKGSGSWLSVLPIEEYGFVLNKGEFRDAIKLRYGRDLHGLPTQCPCGQPYNVNHALNCKKGGFVTIRHNNIRDFEASLMKKVHSDVEIEPPLQVLTGEIVNGLSGDNARPDIRARGVWRDGQNAFFDVRVTNTNAESQKHSTSEKILEKHEKEKKRQYNRRIMNVEHGTFTPLVYSVCGAMGAECFHVS